MSGISRYLPAAAKVPPTIVLETGGGCKGKLGTIRYNGRKRMRRTRMNAATRPALPTHKDLPETDGLPKENAIRSFQIVLLTAVLHPVIAALQLDGRYLIARDVGI